jgi:integrase
MNKDKRGRRPKFVRYKGREIFGLHFHKGSKRYFRYKDGKEEYLGKDLDSAVFEFRRKERSEQRGMKTVEVLIEPLNEKKDLATEPRITDDWGSIAQPVVKIVSNNPEEADIPVYDGNVIDLPELYMIKWAKELILNNPAEAALKLGIPQLANLQDLAPPPKSLSLNEVFTFYETKRKPTTKKELEDSRAWWKEFVKITGVRTIRELTVSLIQKYQNEIYNRKSKEKYSAVWVSHRFGKIRTIFRNALKIGQNQDELRKALDLLVVLDLPEKKQPDPKPIPREYYQRLLAAADLKMCAIMLLALNAGMYAKDLADLEKANLDLTKRKLIARRKKGGRILRVAILWERTVNVLTKYWTEQNPDSESVFLSEWDTPLSANKIRLRWKKLKDRVNKQYEQQPELMIPDELHFDQIRDGAQTSSIEGGCTEEEANYLLGHKAKGVTDAYLVRNPRLTLKAVKAIEKYYFSTEENE